MKKIDEVKKDLKNLKSYTAAINKLKSAQETHLMRIKMLERMTPKESTARIIEKERELLESLDVSIKIEQAQAIEEKYMSAILSLDMLDRNIMIDTYITGLTHWKVGLANGYSEEGIRKKISKIIKKLALVL